MQIKDSTLRFRSNVRRKCSSKKNINYTKHTNKRNKEKEKYLKVISANAAGAANKMKSIIDNIEHVGAGVITLQETHYRKKGKFKINNFEIFESIRRKHGGGTLIGVHKSLEPVLIEEYFEDFELLVVEVKMG